MSYKFNPKTAGSGILGCIPQTGRCPNNCEDCFFQSGRSYLEPLDENLPNMPPMQEAWGRIIRVNDGNDSNVDRDRVLSETNKYMNRFYNTAIPKELDQFIYPVVLTLNPGKMTDTDFHKLPEIPKNLMFVRIRVNNHNLESVVIPAVEYYTSRDVPIVFTFMAYYNQPVWMKENDPDYIFRKRTMNSYTAITTDAWERIMSMFKYNKWVYSCGKIEGEKGVTACRHCGNCIREYYATMERIRST